MNEVLFFFKAGEENFWLENKLWLKSVDSLGIPKRISRRYEL